MDDGELRDHLRLAAAASAASLRSAQLIHDSAIRLHRTACRLLTATIVFAGATLLVFIWSVVRAAR